MDGGVIRTERLLLRPLAPEDAAPIARMIGDWEVIRWLTQPPYPYALADAEAFIAAQLPNHWAITAGGTLMGVISNHAELGYWLGRPYHRQGCMTEAAAAVVAASPRPILSGHHLGNVPSRRILLGLGFRDTHVLRKHSNAHGTEVDVQRMVLR